MMYEIKYGNSTIHYNLIQSNRRKTSQITITPEGVTVRAPKNKTNTEVKTLMQSKASWIFKKQLYFAGKKKPKFSIRSKLSVLGKQYKICVITNRSHKVRLVGGIIEFHIPQKRYAIERLQKQYEQYLLKRAQLLFPKIVTTLSGHVGVKVSKTNIKHLKDRWGSATPSCEINLNYNLIQAPKFVIRYVILHELCHFKIKEHSYSFWRLVGYHMYEYQRAVKWLADNGIRIN